jgi:hypothetical protein
VSIQWEIKRGELPPQKQICDVKAYFKGDEKNLREEWKKSKPNARPIITVEGKATLPRAPLGNPKSFTIEDAVLITDEKK